jgi:hypothetical protein
MAGGTGRKVRGTYVGIDGEIHEGRWMERSM